MTIQLKITNEDSRENAIVSVTNCNADGSDMEGAATHQLKGGEDCTVYVHSGQGARITEVQNG